MINNSLNPWYNFMVGAVLLGHAVLLQQSKMFYTGCEKRKPLRYKHASSYLKSLLTCEKREHMERVLNKEQWKWSRYKESINNSPGLQLSWKDIISINTIQIINKQLRGWTSGPRPVKLCSDRWILKFYLELYKNKLKNLIRTSKFKFHFKECKWENYQYRDIQHNILQKKKIFFFYINFEENQHKISG